VNVLEWTTATELNNDYFTIEKSIDATNFTIVGTKKGAGSSARIIDYSTVDEHPDELTYYRLKQNDNDGKYTYSNIILIKRPALSITNFYPNPTSGDFNINLSSAEDAHVKINVIDISGRELISKYVSIDKGANTINIDVSGLSKGSYFVRVMTNSEICKTQKQFEVQ
jgi:hypothetical protein